MSRVDVAALEDTLAFIETHQEQWYQGCWGHQRECGATHCFAGWALVLAGDDDFDWPENPNLELANMADGSLIQDEAAMVLGLNEEQASTLFLGSNSISDLKRKISLIKLGLTA